MHRRWEWVPSRAAQPWFVGGLFAVVGWALVKLAPHMTGGAELGLGIQADGEVVAFWIVTGLGGYFVALGAILLGMGAVRVWVALRTPWNREAWDWWVQTVGGGLGALSFALPALLVFPAFAIAFVRRPNALFPAGGTSAAALLWTGAGFSALGLGTLALLVWVLRRSVPSRPRWRHTAGADA